jgi:glycoprotein endo-alpha-1,2-mannosidase
MGRIAVALAVAALLVAGPAAASSRVSVFYYPWYGDLAHDRIFLHWHQRGHEPPASIASSFYPLRGVYSSGNPRILQAQMREIARAGIGQLISSWWGRGSVEDLRLREVLGTAWANGLSVAAHLEPYAGRTVVTTEADIQYLRELGITDFYVYAAFEQQAPADWAAMNDRLEGVRIFVNTNLVGKAAKGHFDGLYTYDVLVYDGSSFARVCEQARRHRLLCAPSVGPGYDARRATGDPRVKPRRNGARYDTMWRAAVRARADVVTITSYNEWHEGTQIEPARVGPAPGEIPYQTYTGAYGLTGSKAARAYLLRTALWSRRLDALVSP